MRACTMRAPMRRYAERHFTGMRNREAGPSSYKAAQFRKWTGTLTEPVSLLIEQPCIVCGFRAEETGDGDGVSGRPKHFSR